MLNNITVKSDTKDIGQPDSDNKSQNEQVCDKTAFKSQLKEAKKYLEKQKQKKDDSGDSIFSSGLFSVSELQPLYDVKASSESEISNEQSVVPAQTGLKTTGEQSAQAGQEVIQPLSNMVDSLVFPKDGSLPYMDIVLNSVAPVDPAYFAEQLAKYVAKLQHNIKEVELRVSPKELGQINIKVSFQDGKINVTINILEQYKEHLVKHIDILEETMAENGISIGQMDVTSDNENSSNQDELNYVFGEDVLVENSGEFLGNKKNSTLFKKNSIINNMI